mmetsp:Transcript_18894/g.47484  ORF Transcript_18894/g.47484 Transcript_18894/m.47484 type:complete len:150 (-) Transcript_18894:91-540(-)
MAGPPGRDPGIFQSWPIACACAHAARGRNAEAIAIIETSEEFWLVYSDFLQKGGKDEDYLVSCFRSAMGWNGFQIFLGYYMCGIFIDQLPLQEATQENSLMVKACAGLVGLRLMQYGFANLESSLDLTELQKRQRSIFDASLQILSKDV